MKYLFVTQANDIHTYIVKIALESIGHDVALLFMADLPTKKLASLCINSEKFEWYCEYNNGEISSEPFDVIWWRRPRKPHVPREEVHREDYTFVARENYYFHESFTHCIGPNAWWVNRKEAANRANLKLLQLKVARECGFNLPQTLCSNDPTRIREFISQSTKTFIYKPLCSYFWHEEKVTKGLYTTKIEPSQLPCQEILRLTPGIYQEEIKKQYELRVTCFGDYVVAAKINSQTNKHGSTDWRLIPTEQLEVEPYQLPNQVVRRLRLFMQQLGIVFGAFDFIVTPDNQYIFLEVNEQGQFLWLEDCNKDLMMLDTFIQFLLNKSARFSWNPKAEIHAIEHYEKAADALIMQSEKHHVRVNSFPVNA